MGSNHYLERGVIRHSAFAIPHSTGVPSSLP